MPKNVSWEEVPLFDIPDNNTPRTATKKSRRQQYGQPIPPTVMEDIWAHYTTTFSGGRKPSLSPERQQLITMAVNEYGAADIKRAITGCSLSDWHMGSNPSGKKYTSIELILRDSEHIERFLQLTVAEDNKGGFLDD
jgi:hypothetical protein